MTEAFLQYVWQHQLMCQDKLFTTSNEQIQVVKIGTFNSNAGPDFLNAKIKIGETLWAGDVEIHIKSSDWNTHGHQLQKSYNSVILHVVAIHDKEICTENGTQIPTLILPILPHVKYNFTTFADMNGKINCNNHIQTIDSSRIALFLERLVAERFEEKATHIAELFGNTNNDWEETFYQLLARNFGVKQNQEGFELLAKSLPQRIIAKHKGNLLQVEALFFGQANLWTNNADEYEQSLKKEYQFLQKKYGLSPISPTWWKFARMRPSSFPTIRIAQFAKLVNSSQSLTSKILNCANYEDLKSLLYCSTSVYWEHHYTFGTISTKHSAQIGESMLEILVINAIIPFLFAYGKAHHNDELCQRAYEILLSLPPEKNRIVNQWNACGIPTKSALETQGLLQLFNSYCTQGNCVHCSIGHIVLNKKM